MEKVARTYLVWIRVLLILPYGFSQYFAVDYTDLTNFKNIKIASMLNGLYYCLELTDSSLRKFNFKLCEDNSKQYFTLQVTSDKLAFKIKAHDKQSIILNQSFYFFPTDESYSFMIAQESVNLCLTIMTEENYISSFFSQKCKINPFCNSQKFKLVSLNFTQSLYKVSITYLINGEITNSLSSIIMSTNFTSISDNRVYSGAILSSSVEAYLTKQTYSITLSINTCEYFQPVLPNISISENSTQFTINIQKRIKCSDISGTSACGWCPSKNKAMIGNASSPLNDTCPTSSDGSWTFYAPECPCLSMKTCNSISGNCGWCPSRNKAMAGNVNGPFYQSCPSSSNGDWTMYSPECKCFGISSCTSIISGCGWCDNLKKPMAGSGNYPDYQNCPAKWVNNRNDCQCLRMTYCYAIKGTDCGWCFSKNQALLGDGYGPFYISCSRYTWYSNDC